MTEKDGGGTEGVGEPEDTEPAGEPDGVALGVGVSVLYAGEGEPWVGTEAGGTGSPYWSRRPSAAPDPASRQIGRAHV